MNIFKEFEGETITEEFNYNGQNVEIVADQELNATYVKVNENLINVVDGANKSSIWLAEINAKCYVDNIISDLYETMFENE